MNDGRIAELPFPGAVGITHLRVYTGAGADGVAGGSPHVHLVSAEAYIPTAGRGQVQTLSARGEKTFELRPGGIIWFEPGVIHRLINLDGRLEILVVMQNAGLPEAGDAVMTFPDDVLADREAYSRASLLDGTERSERQASALRRRDLAIQGYTGLRAGGADKLAARLERFHQRIQVLKADRLATWEALVEQGPELEVELTRQRLAAIEDRDTSFLQRAHVARTVAQGDHRGVGMCGDLDAFAPEGMRA